MADVGGWLTCTACDRPWLAEEFDLHDCDAEPVTGRVQGVGFSGCRGAFSAYDGEGRGRGICALCELDAEAHEFDLPQERYNKRDDDLCDVYGCPKRWRTKRPPDQRCEDHPFFPIGRAAATAQSSPQPKGN
jgi:hypothetical protein